MWLCTLFIHDRMIADHCRPWSCSVSSDLEQHVHGLPSPYRNLDIGLCCRFNLTSGRTRRRVVSSLMMTPSLKAQRNFMWNFQNLHLLYSGRQLKPLWLYMILKMVIYIWGNRTETVNYILKWKYMYMKNIFWWKFYAKQLNSITDSFKIVRLGTSK